MYLEDNMGVSDRQIRTISAIGIILLSATGIIKGRLSRGLLGLSAVLVATSAAGYCPTYDALGVNSITDSERARQFEEKVFTIL